jgi:hypothetical protein
LVGVPIDTAISIRIRVDQGDALEACCALDSRDADRIANELCIVKLDERLADGVGAGREIDQGWSSCRRVATLTATRTSSNCCIDCGSIIGASISSCAEVLHISEYLISSGTISSRALSGDRCKPIARCRGSISSRDGSRRRCARDEEEESQSNEEGQN